MLKLIWFIVSIVLIVFIFLRLPQENSGLSSFANKSNILGSPTNAQKALNYITIILIMSYFLIAFLLNQKKDI